MSPRLPSSHITTKKGKTGTIDKVNTICTVKDEKNNEIKAVTASANQLRTSNNALRSTILNDILRKITNISPKVLYIANSNYLSYIQNQTNIQNKKIPQGIDFLSKNAKIRQTGIYIFPTYIGSFHHGRWISIIVKKDNRQLQKTLQGWILDPENAREETKNLQENSTLRSKFVFNREINWNFPHCKPLSESESGPRVVTICLILGIALQENISWQKILVEACEIPISPNALLANFCREATYMAYKKIQEIWKKETMLTKATISTLEKEQSTITTSQNDSRANKGSSKQTTRNLHTLWDSASSISPLSNDTTLEERKKKRKRKKLKAYKKIKKKREQKSINLCNVTDVVKENKFREPKPRPTVNENRKGLQKVGTNIMRPKLIKHNLQVTSKQSTEWRGTSHGQKSKSSSFNAGKEYMETDSNLAKNIDKNRRNFTKNNDTNISKKLQDILQGPEHEILSIVGNNSIDRKSLRSLKPKQWLGDEVINIFLSILQVRHNSIYDHITTRYKLHTYNSFFFSKLLQDNKYNYNNVRNSSRTAPNRNLFSLNKLIIPIHANGNHWTLILINFESKYIEYFDSLGDDGTTYINATYQYIQDEHLKMFHHTLPAQNTWRLITCRGATPQQNNNYDCGVFVCLFAEALTRNATPSFSQEDITDSTRLWIMEAILQKCIPSSNWKYCNTHL